MSRRPKFCAQPSRLIVATECSELPAAKSNELSVHQGARCIPRRHVDEHRDSAGNLRNEAEANCRRSRRRSGNAVNNTIANGLEGAEFIVANTDAQPNIRMITNSATKDVLSRILTSPIWPPFVRLSSGSGRTMVQVHATLELSSASIAQPACFSSDREFSQP